MNATTLQDLVCARWCEFYHPEKQSEERCGSFELLSSLTVSGAQELLAEYQKEEKDGVELDTFLSKIVCESCDYFINWCDYRSKNCDYKAPPCGGLLILRTYLTSGELKLIELLLKP